MDFTIDKELQALIPTPSQEELETLEASLLREGCRDPLVIWKEQGFLLDGHNRYALCTKHNRPYETRAISLPDRDAAKQWMVANQLGRRNLSKEQMSILRATYYKLERQSHGGNRGNQYTTVAKAQNELLPDAATRTAKKFHVSAATIKRDVEYDTNLEAIAGALHLSKQEVSARTQGKLRAQDMKELAGIVEAKPVVVTGVLDDIANLKPDEAQALVRSCVQVVTRGTAPTSAPEPAPEPAPGDTADVLDDDGPDEPDPEPVELTSRISRRLYAKVNSHQAFKSRTHIALHQTEPVTPHRRVKTGR